MDHIIWYNGWRIVMVCLCCSSMSLKHFHPQLWLYLRCIIWLHREASLWHLEVDDTHYAQLGIFALISA